MSKYVYGGRCGDASFAGTRFVFRTRSAPAKDPLEQGKHVSGIPEKERMGQTIPPRGMEFRNCQFRHKPPCTAAYVCVVLDSVPTFNGTVRLPVSTPVYATQENDGSDTTRVYPVPSERCAHLDPKKTRKTHQAI